ncbi:MAG TPA: GNAT family N-acetyltransferase [Pyrinomonadaceae bacterium]|nr:GNAT family N-acetyltransferase [Pyrinomonadaceae bacterium]
MRYSDIELARQLERTEALANADFVGTRARIEPSSGAGWIEVGGAYAMFDGVESPLTQTFGLGMFEDATNEHLDALEAFYKKRSAPVFHEVSPMADQSILPLLGERGYRPIELTSVMYQELGGAKPKLPPLNSNITARVIEPDEADLWAEVASRGWATEHPMLGEFMLAFGKITARTSGGHPFLAVLEGKPIAAGGFAIYDDVCILSGAATIPEARRQGAQNALLSARLDHAAANGCALAMMCALPGSQSQKNAQKNGFNIAYTRIKWQLFN